MLTGILLNRRHGPLVTLAVALGSYAAVVFGGALLLRDDPSVVAGVVVALLATVPAGAVLLASPLAQARREGVERDLLRRSTSAAFLSTMAAALAYGLLEIVAGVPAPSAWWLYGVGMAAWAVISLVGARRYR